MKRLGLFTMVSRAAFKTTKRMNFMTLMHYRLAATYSRPLCFLARVLFASCLCIRVSGLGNTDSNPSNLVEQCWLSRICATNNGANFFLAWFWVESKEQSVNIIINHGSLLRRSWCVKFDGSMRLG